MNRVKKYEMPIKKRENLLDEIELLTVLLAVETGDLSEGQACWLLAIDRVSLRSKKQDYLTSILQEFEKEKERLNSSQSKRKEQ